MGGSGAIRSLVAIILLALPAGAALKPDTPAGPWKVGYRIVYLRDPARDGRLVQMTVWYPSQPVATAKHVLFRTYVDNYFPPINRAARGLRANEKREIEIQYARKAFPGSGQAEVDRLLDSESTAYPDAAPARGRYPVVLFATGGGGTPLTHAPTCELLASHGFYVFTGPSEGRDGLPVYLDAITLDQKVRDMEMPLTVQHDYPGADFTRVLAAGFSLGGGTALLFAQRHPGVKGIASLDGSFGFEPYVDFHGNNGEFEAYRVRAPMLHINVSGYPYNDARLFDAMVFSDRMSISLPGSAHHSFVAGDLIGAVVKGTLDDAYRVAYNFVCEALVEFAKHTLNSAEPWSLTQFREAIHLPDGAVVKVVDGVPAPPEEVRIYELLLTSGGIDRLRSQYDALGPQQGSVRFARETVMEAAAQELRSQHRLNEALEVCQWNLIQYPESWRAENALAAAYRELKNVQQARAHYEKSLAILKNIEAERALSQLR